MITTTARAKRFAEANSLTVSKASLLRSEVIRIGSAIRKDPWPASRKWWKQNDIGPRYKYLLIAAYRFSRGEIKVSDPANLRINLGSMQKRMADAFNFGKLIYVDRFFSLVPALDAPAYFGILAKWEKLFDDIISRSRKVYLIKQKEGKRFEWPSEFAALISPISAWRYNKIQMTGRVKYEFGRLLGKMNEFASLLRDTRAHNSAVAQGLPSKVTVSSTSRTTETKTETKPPSSSVPLSYNASSGEVVDDDETEIDEDGTEILPGPGEDIDVIQPLQQAPSFLRSPYLWVGLAAGVGTLFLLSRR